MLAATIEKYKTRTPKMKWLGRIFSPLSRDSGLSDRPAPPFELRSSYLQLAEIQVFPAEFRMTFSRKHDGVIFFKRAKNAEMETYLLRQGTARRSIETGLDSMHRLIQKHHIMDSPSRIIAFKWLERFLVKTEVTRLRFFYATNDRGRDWLYWQATDKLPPNVQAFYNDCFQLALNLMAGAKWTKIAGNEYAQRRDSWRKTRRW